MIYEDGTKTNQFNIKKCICMDTFNQIIMKQKQTSLIAVKSFVVLSAAIAV